jgi:predicted TIM-barrel fold metal-dependent hydrolase
MSNKPPLSRRNFLRASAAGAALAGPGFAASTAAQGAADSEEAPAGPVIDCHAHFTHHGSSSWKERDEKLIDAADRLGIDQLCTSILTPKRPATAEGFRQCNAWLAEGTKRFPGRVLGYCYVNPGCGDAALDEVRRYVEEHGFIGVKLYNEHKCTDPVVFPVVELSIELKVPILHHAGHGHHPIPKQPNISDGGDLAELGRRYPEARLICAHVGGGGDWEWTIKALRHAENVFLDTSGSVTDEGIVDMAVDILGADRLLFGCDMSMTAGVGKIRAARLSPDQRRKILGGNMSRLLAMRAH